MLILPDRQCRRRFGRQPRAAEILQLAVSQRHVARKRRVLDRVVDVRRGRWPIEEQAHAAAHDEGLLALDIPRGAETRRHRQRRIHEVRLRDVLHRESGSRSAIARVRHERADCQWAVRPEQRAVTGFIAWRLVPEHVVAPFAQPAMYNSGPAARFHSSGKKFAAFRYASYCGTWCTNRSP